MHFSRENVEKLLAGNTFFWIDVDQPNKADYTILRDVFKFHPLAVEDSEKFGQRAKIDDYDDFVFLVVYGAVPDDDRLVEAGGDRVGTVIDARGNHADVSGGDAAFAQILLGAW